MNKMRHLSTTPLFSAILALSGTTVTSAASYNVSLSGFAIDQITTIQNLPGVPTAPLQPQYQLPRLGAYGTGPGWNSTLELTIDAISGEVSDFTMSIREAGIYGSGGPQWLVRTDEHEYSASPLYGPAVCSVTHGGNDLDGTLVYDCPSIFYAENFASLNATGSLCATPNPSILAPGANGCGAPWGGFPAGFSTPVVSTRAGIAVPANAVVDGTSVSLNGINPPAYVSLDPVQNANGIEVSEFQGNRTSGNFSIQHTDTLAGGDFVVTKIDYTQILDVQFVNTSSNPIVTAHVVDSFEFNTVVSQDFALSANDAKAVPAMGALSLTALLGGLVSVATALYQRRRLKVRNNK